jgi:allantoicase
VRLNIHPDGGVARLRLYGEARPDRRALEALAARGEPADLAAARNGATVLAASDEYFGEPLNLLMPGPGAGMQDGWETRRRRGPGHDWVVLRLGHRGRIERVEVDTRHFKGNHPTACSLEGCDAPAFPKFDAPGDEVEWREILPRSDLGPDAVHAFEGEEVREVGPVTHARFHIYPDGGVSRLRLWGRSAADAEFEGGEEEAGTGRAGAG